jgi:hypothetical protein
VAIECRSFGPEIHTERATWQFAVRALLPLTHSVAHGSQTNSLRYKTKATSDDAFVCLRGHGFSVGIGAGGGVGEFVKGDNLAAFDGEDVGKIAVELAAVGFQAPFVVTD